MITSRLSGRHKSLFRKKIHGATVRAALKSEVLVCFVSKPCLILYDRVIFAALHQMPYALFELPV